MFCKEAASSWKISFSGLSIVADVSFFFFLSTPYEIQTHLPEWGFALFKVNVQTQTKAAVVSTYI